ncbi:TetR/AcrR family transcriptional regulator C-terminal domain-containing protein [Alloacidobacterium sp.]|uniref:TetR/AcrR family transcriptional regulator C-terminal domain-containing protein n=1 Tax=Alloacidobacterium sp. TaxID=2951999 RepID=UPI002D3CFC2A|nr:TetR/AcrR family transcriptional regulator C-terminal domain-containing protein [Alloacidobacterium sp.]HYK35358.1 TetR/AcrR family transcriptional regulator C-terminal domain-containing protein [Alloacidobacterium sp.]
MPLDRTIVIDSALKLLDEVGLEGLTLRRLAAVLDVQAPAIYWHFKNKQELLDEMATTALMRGLKEMSWSTRTRWEKWGLAYGRNLRRIFLTYRDGARMISGTRLTDTSLYKPMEGALGRLAEMGYSNYQAVVALSTIYSYVVGFVIEEQAAAGDAFFELEARNARIDPAQPLAREAGKYIFTQYDRRFMDGLRIIIAGLAATRKQPK